MEFKDIGNTMEPIAEGVMPKKWYPSITVDLKKCPELSKDIGDECIAVIKGKVVSKRLDEHSAEQTIEIREIAVKSDEKPKNEADEILASLQKTKRY